MGINNPPEAVDFRKGMEFANMKIIIDDLYTQRGHQARKYRENVSIYYTLLNR